MLSGAYPGRVGFVFREDEKSIHRTQMCIPLKPVFSRHKRDGVQISDEPTDALDYAASKEILKLIENINKKYGNTVLMVTHNGAIQYMADRIVRLRDGRVKENERNTHKIPAGQLEW